MPPVASLVFLMRLSYHESKRASTQLLWHPLLNYALHWTNLFFCEISISMDNPIFNCIFSFVFCSLLIRIHKHVTVSFFLSSVARYFLFCSWYDSNCFCLVFRTLLFCTFYWCCDGLYSLLNWKWWGKFIQFPVDCTSFSLDYLCERYLLFMSLL